MKTTLLLFLLCIFNLGDKPIDKLIGSWELKKVEAKGRTFYPKTKDFFLNINDSHIGFFDGCNVESGTIISVTNTQLNVKINPGLTVRKKCALTDPIAKYIDYIGSYVLNDSLLIITNDKGKHYLIKQP